MIVSKENVLIQVWICDDNKRMALLIAEFVKKAFNSRETAYLLDIFFDGKEVVDTLNKESKWPDVLFLAIKMKKISGYKVAELLNELHCRTLLIFISAYSELFYESLKYLPFGYIVKRYMKYEIDYFIKKAEIVLESFKNRFTCINENNNVMNEEDILYIESKDKKSFIHMVYGNVVPIRKSLDYISNKINKDYLYKISRSILVNFRHIRGYTDEYLILNDGSMFKLSRGRIHDVKNSVKNYFMTGDI